MLFKSKGDKPVKDVPVAENSRSDETSDDKQKKTMRYIAIVLVCITGAGCGAAYGLTNANTAKANSSESTATSIVTVTNPDGTVKTTVVTDPSTGKAVTNSDGTTVTEAVTTSINVATTTTAKNGKDSKTTTTTTTKKAATSGNGSSAQAATPAANTTKAAAKSTTAKVTAAATTAAAKATTVVPTTAAKTGLSEPYLIPDMVTMVNNARAAAGLNTAGNDPALDSVALIRVKELVSEVAAGTVHSGAGKYAILQGGENAAEVMEWDSTQDVFNGFMNSAGHKRLIMDDETQYGYSKLYCSCARIHSYDTGYDYVIMDFEIAE